ncbi:assimilatory nitrite reductase (NAD(P)H) large subunit precursor [Filimonas lacunae]|uniref:Assimilatory nitrite reductase (NAD(P)H) large subunit n=1 Tax=Filimonas lacunae TaxID=477680 RepID=A0A173MJN9_9BACT|nr:nitrite reductase large subunit NirB [Filimonas lacunae]BAV07608.1 nitrite reductase [NAD(P)H] large subunit [Filimonas lacunae]SIT29801.1 assimilatory nitrite reductase (NAD(P)H) large subunit precursor [Filimonas lacunae]
MRIVIIGNGMVGFKFCEKFLAKAPAGTAELIVFGEENYPAYDRVHLSEFFAGKNADDLSMAPVGWYQENGITLHLGDPVQRIDLENKVVHSFKGKAVVFDYLVMATGSAAFVPPVPGVEKEGVFLYRTIEDLEMMKAYAPKARKAAVIGGGLLGLEAAKALLDLGITDTHVIEFAPRLMPRQIDDAGSDILKGLLQSLGLTIHTNKNTVAITGEKAIDGMRFADHTTLDVDMLVISAGIKPRDELAAHAGLQTGPRGGIVVNDKLQTSHPSVFAIGECALYNDFIYGLVAPGYEMAEVVATHLTGGDKAFTGFDMSTKLKLIGIDVASFGEPFIAADKGRTIVLQDTVKGVYKRINTSLDGKYLLGGVLVGDAAEYNMLLQTTKNKVVLPPDPTEVILGARGGSAEKGSGVAALPGDALICSCEGITKDDIMQQVQHGCETLDAIKKSCKAATGCGGCAPMVKDIMEHTLKAQGKYVRKVVCEHFEYSRQELYDLVKLKQLQTYDEVLNELGKGDGCEVCKPLISSVLASLWNDLVLAKGNDTAQDSNDRFLANIQKGGTYSVVPRIPGGEITPDKLIVIGNVAKKYNLYTKITGGQRIDLFGAHVSDLPLIWEELIAAGFESGHAYGKALRTVKSCVGSTWCRFGLQDSVSFAIQVEERYRGLRAPHKFKSAVSGCIRECAEAQSKDFGIIATEKGWNLYVCGNGGSKPQHALLLATDIDSDTCIRYLDRFLMFYIKTADPLTRTATWLNKMEGGIDYLRNVVVNDSLGMAETFEAEMQQLVNNYKCEWREVVETPELRKRFVHFINAPQEKDPEVKFEILRDQKKAKEWK